MNRDDLDKFFSEYDDVTSDVANSTSATFETNLDRWFEFLDEIPLVTRVTSDLQTRLNFDEWYNESEKTVGSWVGSGELRWPKGKENRLSAQLSLFRSFAQEKRNYVDFHHEFVGTSSQFDDMVFDLNRQIFSPMARDLKRHMDQMFTPLSEQQLLMTPASDRTVPINHNSVDYAEAIEQLDRLEELIRTSNEFSENAESRQSIAAEVSATRRLLDAMMVRLDAIISLCYRTLESLAKKFADLALGKIASAVLTLLGKITGLW